MQLKKIIRILSCGFAFMAICCSSDSGQGRLGIEVPTGDGKISDETPYVIHGVYEGPAYDAGIKADDVIVQIDDVPLRKGMTHDYVYRSLLLGRPGTKVTIVVDRKGERYVFDVVRAPK
jgi:C-terminal processing protease CtpA/Prc